MFYFIKNSLAISGQH